jgi:hypothetical protein
MVCVLVHLLLKRKVGVLFRILRGPCSDASKHSKMETIRHHNDTEPEPAKKKGASLQRPLSEGSK